EARERAFARIPRRLQRRQAPCRGAPAEECGACRRFVRERTEGAHALIGLDGTFRTGLSSRDNKGGWTDVFEAHRSRGRRQVRAFGLALRGGDANLSVMIGQPVMSGRGVVGVDTRLGLRLGRSVALILVALTLAALGFVVVRGTQPPAQLRAAQGHLATRLPVT